jgi:hypothetical protein
MRAIESVLLQTSERSIAREFGWEKLETERGVSLYHPDSPALLTPHDLEAMLTNPGDVDFLSNIPVQPIDSGRYGSVYDITGTDLVVKKYFPDTYFGGYENRGLSGPPAMRRVSGSSILNGLIINLGLEQALRPVPEYTTPHYLGHLMLYGDSGIRHYSIMTKLEAYQPTTSEETVQIEKLKQQAKTMCILAMRNAGKRTKFIDWDIEYEHGYRNVIPTKSDQKIALGIIDQQNIFSSGRRIPGAPLKSRRHHDPDAPWLSISQALVTPR